MDNSPLKEAHDLQDHLKQAKVLSKFKEQWDPSKRHGDFGHLLRTYITVDIREHLKDVRFIESIDGTRKKVTVSRASMMPLRSAKMTIFQTILRSILK